MKIEAFVIHLERSEERRPQVKKILANLPVAAQVLTAIDWKDLSSEALSAVEGKHLARPHYPFRLRHSEIACFLSHRKAWAEIGKRGLDAALIVEDDIAVDHELFAAAFELALRHFHAGDYVRFPEKLREKHDIVLEQCRGQTIFRPQCTGLGMLAQLVGSDCARQLLRHSQFFDRPVDGFLQIHWLHGIKPKSVTPAGVCEISATLGGSTITKPRSIGAKLYAELARTMYRVQLVHLARKSSGNAS